MLQNCVNIESICYFLQLHILLLKVKCYLIIGKFLLLRGDPRFVLDSHITWSVYMHDYRIRDSCNGYFFSFSSESTGQPSHHLEPSDHAAAPRLSPRSILETLPSSSPLNASHRGINHNTLKLSLNGVNGVHLGPGTSRPYALPLSMDSQSGSSTSLLRGVDQNYDRLIMQRST